MKYYLSIILLIVSLFLSIRVIQLSKQNQQYKIDQAEVNSIQYGLLNVDEWKEHLAHILTKKVEEFELTPENQARLKPQIESMLNALLDEVEVILKSDVGKIKRVLINVFVNMEKLRENVPEFADALLEELSNPENKEDIKAYILLKLDAFVDSTFSSDRREGLLSILEKYDYDDKEDGSYYLGVLANRSGNNLMVSSLFLILFLGMVFMLNSMKIKTLTKRNSSFLLLSLLLLIICGIAMPMIDIEAKISRLTFQLMNESIIFENQVLFFQSKSILDVVWVLSSTGKLDMVFVSILIFGFSVLFPFTKLICSFLVTFYHEKFHQSKWVYFFTYKSGKWSMADVFVVALFMAFIGFNGIVSSQLSQLSDVNENVEVLTTNGTGLQAGFYLFLMFCIGGLFLAEVFQKNAKNTQP